MRRTATVASLISLLTTSLPAAVQQAAAGKGFYYETELSATTGGGDFAPFWLSSNRYGLSSVEPGSGYLRGALLRPVSTGDTIAARPWDWGFAADLAVAGNHASDFIVQQLYGELRYHRVHLSIGSKEHRMELKNNDLSTGSQTFGINARPVPQVRLSLPRYWNLPLTREWVQVKGFVAYGQFTDDSWQHRFTGRQSRYADHVRYHAKAGYIRFGKDGSSPLSLQLGLEMATQFGGTTYQRQGDTMVGTPNSSGPSAYWHAFIPGGSENYEQGTAYENIEGNHVGSYLARLSYNAQSWQASLYADHYFEDQSSMFLVDFDGYGSGEQWNLRTRRSRYLLYDLRDMLVGAELQLKRGTWLRTLLMEYVYSKYQSGPIYHDHNPGLSDHIGGIDEYYNHNLYPGWQHWGQVMGNPLYRSPLYNQDGTVYVKDNRFTAFHLGADGQVCPTLAYRLLATWQTGYGTYRQPYTHPRHQFMFMAEATYTPRRRGWQGWSATAAVGVDHGSIFGDNCGLRLSITRQGQLAW